ncbi:MAG TPA: hypothetical protein VFJ16_22735 [Longimicrobium sp.]|nr:hypothetical protein [Longimicrobium sp.]
MQSSDVPNGGDAPRVPAVRRVLRPVPRAPEPAGEPPAGEAEGRLLRPAAACPRCGARPAMRVTAALVRALDGQAATVRVATYQCQRRGCGAIYDISAGAYLRAS